MLMCIIPKDLPQLCALFILDLYIRLHYFPKHFLKTPLENAYSEKLAYPCKILCAKAIRSYNTNFSWDFLIDFDVTRLEKW